jgi:hypothetical protein
MDITEVASFMACLKPFVAHQFIISVFAAWAEMQQQQAGVGVGKSEVTTSFLSALKRSLDTVPIGETIGLARDVGHGSPEVTWGETIRRKAEVVARMSNLPLESAAEVLAETTARWGFMIPREQYQLMWVVPRDASRQAIADAIYEWFVRYFDLWT